MSCNCKVKESVDNIKRTYGDNTIEEKNNKLVVFVERFLISLFIILLLPIVFIHIFYRGLILNKRYFSVKDLVRKFGYGRK